jgi:hypothetical protein
MHEALLILAIAAALIFAQIAARGLLPDETFDPDGTIAGDAPVP